ncbi:FAD binding protein [Schizosaccharomyces japonicus yFS275]|uniref:FAD binding protein n=1 Tax=Schizosaccharomyces japonicus (strain yFS275 / FY16936) TaxID=402676 RepID=B6K5R6_SCHJY|nr:FAD binding protein [Schizosaccharomyces japonicus yFS275]EEB08870.1 FAD binding protein [Schizosaccharomyces japonicus yFS275]
MLHNTKYLFSCISTTFRLHKHISSLYLPNDFLRSFHSGFRSCKNANFLFNSLLRELNIDVSYLKEHPNTPDFSSPPQKRVTLINADNELSNEKYVGTGNENRPPKFIEPHPPYPVHCAPVLDAKLLNKPSALKKTYNITIDVSHYPLPQGTEWLVGGTIGVMAPNSDISVTRLLTALNITMQDAIKPCILITSSGRWPSMWGENKPREIRTNIYELLRWTTDFLSQPPSKDLLQLLGFSSKDPLERLLISQLMKRPSNLCYPNTSSYNITVLQLLEMFPHSTPSIDYLLSVLPQLMPRWYSMSNDPKLTPGSLEFAVTVQEFKDLNNISYKGIGSGFLERLAQMVMSAKHNGKATSENVVLLPMYRGLQRNQFALNFKDKGPMILIGVGVGIAPFRGFVQRRLSNPSNMGNIWIFQGCRDHTKDELFSEDLRNISMNNQKVIKILAESRVGRKEHVQDALKRNPGIVWDVINDKNGHIYLCGSGHGLVKDIEQVLLEVTMKYLKCTLQEAQQVMKEWQTTPPFKFIEEVW